MVGGKIERKEGTGFLLGGFPGYWTERRISELPAEGERFLLCKFRDSRIISVALSLQSPSSLQQRSIPVST
ncbi:hypothetical protein VNO77_23253 [Canavalia gladiata]|uniref:Uncharacterized protein n=1 Tax=Canavalia gladiata TaxID=3824 RepID=A0AAN9L6M0_CANGL